MVGWRSVVWVVALFAGLVCAGAALAGGPLGERVRVSQAGPDGDAAFLAVAPAVAYNSAAQQFLVVWVGDTATVGEREIWGRLLDGSGSPLGGQFRISDMGPDGDPAYGATAPAVAYNPTADEYLVTWHGRDDTLPLVNGEEEIFVQRLSASGSQLGANDARISSMGPDGDPAYDAHNSAVAYNPAADEYLVTWRGEDIVDNEREIFVQRLSASGNELGTDDRRISSMGPDGDPAYDADRPAVAYNPTADEYLVTWDGEDIVDNEREIFVQRLSAIGNELGADDRRISSMGPNGDPAYDAERPAVAYNAVANEYLVTWWGDDNTGPLVDEEFEIFVQRLSATGNELGTDDRRISSMGPNGDPDYSAFTSAVAYNPTANEYLVSWHGSDDTLPLVVDEFEIFVQRLSATGGQLGTDDARISSMGPNGDPAYDAGDAAVAYNPIANEYLVTWRGDDNTGLLVDNEREIFARRALAGAPPAPAPTGAPPGADTRAPAVRFIGKALTLGKRRLLRIPLRCPVHEINGCTGTVTIRTSTKVPARFLAHGPERALTLTLAKARRVFFVKNKKFTINGGQTKNVTVRLSKKNNAILRRAKKLRVRVITRAKDQAGNARTTTTKRRIVLKAPTRKNTN